MCDNDDNNKMPSTSLFELEELASEHDEAYALLEVENK